jgi:hypothetical protein
MLFNRAMQQPKPSLQTSQLLQEFLQQHPENLIRLKVLIDGLGNRAFGPALLVCALPEALPLPIAGISAIIGIPLLLLSIQLLLGFSKPWLPRWLADRPIKRQNLEQSVHYTLRFLRKFEHVIRPRWKFATTPPIQRLLGLLFLLLSVVIFLPIPFGNVLPAIAIVVISLGLIEEDGVLVVGGIVAAALILVIMTSAIVAFFSWAFSALRAGS